MINKAVIYFTKGLTATTKITIKLCSELIHFEMISTLITFNGYSYKYHGGEKKEQGLEIGEHKSASLADLDLVYYYLLKNTRTISSKKYTTTSIAIIF